MFKKFALASFAAAALAAASLPAQAYYVVHRTVMVHPAYGYGMSHAIVSGVVAGAVVNSYQRPVIVQQVVPQPVIVQQQPQVIYQQAPQQIIQQQPQVIVQPRPQVQQ